MTALRVRATQSGAGPSDAARIVAALTGEPSASEALGSLDRLTEPQAFSAWFATTVVRTIPKLLRHRHLTRRLFRRGEPALDLARGVGR